MKRSLLALSAAALLVFSLAACGNNKNNGADNNEGNGSALEENMTPDGNQGGTANNSNAGNGTEGNNGMNAAAVSKAECNSVYAEVISVNGGNLTVSAGDKVLSLTVDADLLVNWSEGDEVILYYTGAFGEGMQVHYIDKWTENSEVQRPDNKNNNTAENGTGGSAVG